MSKREKFLLQLLICIGVVGVFAVYLLLPAIKKNIKLKQEVVEAEDLAMQMETTINDSAAVIEGYEKSKKQVDETYEFFWGEMESFNVDEFINQLVVDNNISIMSLNIGEYKEMDDSELMSQTDIKEAMVFDSDTEESEDEDSDDDVAADSDKPLLVGREVRLACAGNYGDVLNLMDDLNAKSDCIRINSMNYAKDYNYVTGGDRKGALSKELRKVEGKQSEEEEVIESKSKKDKEAAADEKVDEEPQEDITLSENEEDVFLKTVDISLTIYGIKPYVESIPKEEKEADE